MEKPDIFPAHDLQKASGIGTHLQRILGRCREPDDFRSLSPRRLFEAAALGLPLDLVAETMRSATGELDGITGATTPEDLLDRIFAGFCLGK